MKLIKRIRKVAGRISFKKAVNNQKRQRAVLDFEAAKSVLILFDIDTNEELILIKKYLGTLKLAGKNVKGIGFYDSPQPYLQSYSKIDFEILNRKNINWYLKPSDPFLGRISSDTHDILINLSIKNFFPLKYIAGISLAKTKIGAYNYEDQFIYDMMIDLGDKKELKYFIQQVDHYLKMINNKSTA